MRGTREESEVNRACKASLVRRRWRGGVNISIERVGQFGQRGRLTLAQLKSMLDSEWKFGQK